MRNVVLSKAVSPAAMAALAGKVTTIILKDSTPEGTKKALAEAEGLILRTNIRLTRELIESAPKLKIVSRTGVGVDNVDVKSATEKGILVCNTPGANTISVAEQTIALLLASAKRLTTMDAGVRRGAWELRSANMTTDVEGKTLGLIGLGAIGSAVATKCRLAFAMNAIAFDPFVRQMDGVEMCSTIEDVFKRADFVSVHVPYMEKTHHLIDGRLLSLMKPSACLINTARGAIIDEKALVKALADNAIAAAALDVLEEEPPKGTNALLGLDNVILTPHSAALTRECEERVALTAVQAVLDFVEGRQPRYIFNRKELGIQ
jgi:D-3-phosphoglycerate dehydrogenase / 2-oxoglutarate reductase